MHISPWRNRLSSGINAESYRIPSKLQQQRRRFLAATAGAEEISYDCDVPVNKKSQSKGVFMDHLEISYRFTLKDGTVDIIDLRLDPITLKLIDNIPEDLPAWSELGFHQCPKCPLAPADHSHCPAAANLVNLVQRFARVLSHEWVATEVTTAERSYAQETPAQRSVSSLMGLIMAVSGCPLTAFFRPMARFHVPWASQDETIYRATSMYLLAQYLRKRDGKAGELELDGLTKIYEDIRMVNRCFVERLRAASEQDSTINAIVVLDTQALTMPWAIESSLEELRPGFEPYLTTP